MGRGRAGGVELERGGIFGGGVGADGIMGAQKGEQIQTGVWGGISKEEVCHDTGDLVRLCGPGRDWEFRRGGL